MPDQTAPGSCQRVLCPDALNGRPHWHTPPDEPMSTPDGDVTTVVYGPVRVTERPRTALVGRDAYRTPEKPNRADLYRLAAWVEERGGSAPFVNDDGVLVISNYLGDDGQPDGSHYYAFVGGESLIVHDAETGEFGDYGSAGYDFEEIS